MIFARYCGPPDPNWTRGKIYLAMVGFEDRSAVELEQVRLQDDVDTWREIKTADGLFIFPAFVYAVVVKPIRSLACGNVVRVSRCAEGFCDVALFGYLSRCHFEILDRTNVALGNKVRDFAGGVWYRISRLDDELNIGFTDDEVMYPPENFDFPVADGSVLSEPLLKCVKGVEGELTEGKFYSPEKEHDGLVVVSNDAGKLMSYMSERFSNGS